ncbi:PREDICTED: B-cell receptor-associated protein 31 [Dinoponera quadriceps]|uniref:Endoplasmic reticulum transmembrane protein n=1 Tax=Dinoponera quadriceps TaxID=609295 RepID=A0A6P3WW69_DINQU|nr:PREDICTED: B-cell receptor-associated protein 31 [Dinoponera quadriceps]XP_014470392.1 PREDICTED: B-cell receptor-associated protein 31 [Dinoponera quadriceps]XP_014470393.1 PREDICTED: B-cell receptor-associated protein 31 [Dinoponera quadriceps]XP_014470394.1 PREDICTED: B-cell receptor-associated protein 31 [Dinoponera quadriceps]XP_014470395.1 PREDICTED: B-cell receptor-associated protein 31 [Dinoponera quadriceps]XP_014470396.1 PREDICTED: B-cell receptor-associated protein 31 [Dinoponera
MSLQWTLIAGFLYVEVAIVLMLVLPVASPSRWQKLFKSRFLQSLSSRASIYFVVLLGVLVLFLLDAIREMRKYSSSLDHTEHQHLNVEMQENMRLFRAQRNFYISGFALFLSLVIRRLVLLISIQASLLAQNEAAMRQAQSATTTARSLLSQRTIGESAQNDSNEAHDKAVSELKNQIKELQAKNLELEKELTKESKDKEALKSQADSLAKEYDRLSGEHAKVMQSSGDKKSD